MAKIWRPLTLFKWKEAGVPFCLQLSFSPNPVPGGEKLTCKMRSTTENKKATFITQLHLYLFKYWLYSYVNDKRPTVPLLNPKIPPSSIRNGEANCPPSFSLYLNHNWRKQTLKKKQTWTNQNNNQIIKLKKTDKCDYVMINDLITKKSVYTILSYQRNDSKYPEH